MIAITDFREAVEVTCGNLAHAASVLEISKRHVMRLARRYALNDFARDLRGMFGKTHGRPRNER